MGNHADGNKLSAHESSFENPKRNRAAVVGPVDIGARELKVRVFQARVTRPAEAGYERRGRYRPVED